MPAVAATWYVDGLNGGMRAAGTAASPYLRLWQALQKVQPGDTILLVGSMTYPMLGFTANGVPGAPITLASADPAHLTRVSGMGVNAGIWMNGNYLVVRNLDVTAPGPYGAITTAQGRHHLTMANNIVHDAGGVGIGTFSNDYVTISHNVVYGNARDTSRFLGSGIGVLGSVDIDGNTGVKMIIDGNIVYNNTNTPNCTSRQCLASAPDSDGNGIILDDNQRQRFDHVAYRGGFLISNNVVYRNGGRGVHIYRSDHATVTGNTLYQNNQDPYEGSWHPGEIAVVQGGDVGIYDNVLYSDGRAGINTSGTAPNTHVGIMFEGCSDGRGPLIASHNLAYNPQNDATLLAYAAGNANPVSVTQNQFAGTKLVNPNGGDFRFTSASPAYLAAYPALSVGVDILGTSRTPLPSIGAYQNPGP